MYYNQKPCGLVAQLVEQRTENPCVGGSSPPWATLLFLVLPKLAFLLLCVTLLGCQNDPCMTLCQDISNQLRSCGWSNLTNAELRSLRVSCQNRWQIKRGRADGRILEDAYEQCELTIEEIAAAKEPCDVLRAIYLQQE